MCSYTMLARIQARAEALPAMRRLAGRLQKLGISPGYEWLYETVCDLGEFDVIASVEHYDWPKALRGSELRYTGPR